jgi:hypothetical protein
LISPQETILRSPIMNAMREGSLIIFSSSKKRFYCRLIMVEVMVFRMRG